MIRSVFGRVHHYFYIKSQLEKKYRSLGAQISKTAYVDLTSTIEKYVALFDRVEIINSHIGSFSYIQSGSVIFNTHIGKFCSVASDVKLGMAEHPLSGVSTSPVFYDKSQPLPMALTDEKSIFGQQIQTSIASDVWIGQGAIVKSGVSISVGSVIGAGSIVTRDVPPYTIVAGNPARTIRRRFSDEICAELLASKWWELDPELLKELSVFFPKPQAFLDQLRSRKLV